MMKPDDEQQTTLAKSTDANNLISEAFNLSASFPAIQPLTLLPPSPNHFKPITHSRTPSVDIKESFKNAAADSASKTSTNLFNTLDTKSASSFFEQPDLGKNAFNSVIPPQPFPLAQTETSATANVDTAKTKLESLSLNAPKLTSPSLFAPKPTKSISASSVSNPATLPKIGSSSNLGFSNIPPPVSVPPLASGLAPTSNLPPPTATPLPALPLPATTATSSNPYSAKGALNKKVYDTGIPVAQTTAPMSPAFLVPPTSDNKPAVDLFVPPANSSPTQLPFSEPSTANSSIQPAAAVFPPNLTSPQQSSLFMPPPVQPPIQPTTNQNYQQDYSQTSNYPSYNQHQSPAQPVINYDERSVDKSYMSQQTSQQQQQQQQQQNRNMWNWFSQNKIINTIKHGVESIVTTVDPQMKDFMHPANRPMFIVSSTSNVKVCNLIREAFHNAGFSKITVQAMDSQNSSQFAPQIVGFPCALQSAKEKLENTLYYIQQTDCIVLSLQDFLAEITADCWHEMAVIMLKDKINNIDLTVFTESIPIGSEEIGQLQQYTPEDYALKWSGFACRLPEKNFNFNAINANNPNSSLSYETNDTFISHMRLANTIKTLTLLFKNKLLSQYSK